MHSDFSHPLQPCCHGAPPRHARPSPLPLPHFQTIGQAMIPLGPETNGGNGCPAILSPIDRVQLRDVFFVLRNLCFCDLFR
jgi:cytochrome c1